MTHFPANWTFEGVAEELDQRIPEIFALRQRVMEAELDSKGNTPAWLVDMTRDFLYGG